MNINPSIIGLKEFRINSGKYISAVSRGETFTVVRRSKPVFRIVSVDEWGDEGKWETALDLSRGKDKKITAGELLKRFRKIDDRQSRKVSAKA